MNKDNAKDFLPLVQAMAEGKVIQEWSYGEACEKVWTDVDIVECSGKPSRYRIKPEPREIVLIEFSDGSFRKARSDEVSYGGVPGISSARIIRYREVIE